MRLNHSQGFVPFGNLRVWYFLSVVLENAYTAGECVESTAHSVQLEPLEYAGQNSLMLGLFLPIQSGAWSPSTAPRGTSWTFDYNARCTLLAEELGFDLVFGLAQWLGKGGYGGAMKFREHATDPLLVTAALAPLTRNIILISTVHILYGWHPLHLAKFAASID